ncbi:MULTISPECIES: histidine--tRNA ligase [unclassified Planococcus (in: firmicutes)]|uniref:histidine--tRNA ligase n=1 Tax=unclassified Planococcus (in: firmicutes) TaxID=2662419 RepID=UPI000C34B526|nr:MULTISPECIES: histidine--tRNA ligase [unclassified Planococcus (in: firmicutes)]AUD13704.1 histidine--tRNA ligase [Planococcus sp. MB-3u-03]PKG45826.1 histidine--tRNA ligase [Planococcus sp. Urea-trap-24]PKG88465.1 histidine--tRNA ligase [Planococcus sp. Urea-3u-39]PKH38817.1 histidine--tRNA ligase [Planococcus sp. MB-3u-09]
MGNIQAPRGTYDVLPQESAKWQEVERTINELCNLYQYKEIRTPVFEHTELFQRGVGDTTDIVQKEMYTFQDRGDRSLTLRPEGTASVVRSYVEHKLFGQPDQPVKLYYTGPMFRYERPQAGRMRQFVQFGVEAIGSKDPAIDAEVIALAMDVYKSSGLKSLRLVLNSLGDTESRLAHKQALIEHFAPSIEEFCGDCQNRLDKNPLRILDCKVDREHPLMATAPSLADYLNEESAAYFTQVKDYLDELGISYVVDPNLVRGLDYYNHTAFEIMSEAEGFGAITTLAGGGRYNGLVEDLGGPESPGIGFAMSIERLLLALEMEKVEIGQDQSLDAYVIAMDAASKKKAVSIVRDLRANGISADMDFTDRKMKAQMKSADRKKARFVIVIGESELESGKAAVKEMATRDQQEVPFGELAENIQKKKSLEE